MLNQCRLITAPKISDERGALSFIEGDHHIPFAIKRIYYLYDMAESSIRGDHAHKKFQRFLLPIYGSFHILLDDGKEKINFLLDKPQEGIFVPAMIWSRLYDFSLGAVCLVLTDQLYHEGDYIRDYKKFLSLIDGEK